MDGPSPESVKRSPVALSVAARQLIVVGRAFHARGWAPGTAGNFSIVLERDPLRLALTASGADKGRLRLRDVLEYVEGQSAPPHTEPQPSAESLLHVAIAAHTGAGAVLHTHSVCATVLSEIHARHGAVTIEGYEMLKGLDGVVTHQHRERIPVLANDQDMSCLSRCVRLAIEENPKVHGLLLERHGLYTWGASLADAVRHVEVLEFLFEAVVRVAQLRNAGDAGSGDLREPSKEAVWG